MKKLLIFDMDGTLYLGKNLIDGSLESIKYLKDNNIHYVFFTNNSSHDLDFYFKKMSDFGFPSKLEENYYSSVEVTISYLLDKRLKRSSLLETNPLKTNFPNILNLFLHITKT